MNENKKNKIEGLADKSVRFLKSCDKMQPLYLAFSGGKDSVVIYHLAKMAKIHFKAYYTNTTIDPKGTLSFIRNNFKDVEIIQPKESFYKLIERKGLPTRLCRFCCDILKEYGSIGKNVIEGVRSSESKNRQNREFITCDTRKSQKGAKHIYPIYNWTDEDVWTFIEINNLPIAPAYKNGFKRLGCVGCPLVTRKGARVEEFKKQPNVLKAIKKAIEKGMNNNPQWKLTQLTGNDSVKALQYWISGKTMNEYFNNGLDLFGDSQQSVGNFIFDFLNENTKQRDNVS